MTEDRNELSKQKGFRLEKGWGRAIASCKLCEKQYNAAILLALGWGCWKIYASKPDTTMYGEAMVNLSTCLCRAGRGDEAQQVCDALDHEIQRLAARKESHLALKAKLDAGGDAPRVESRKEHIDRYY